MSEVTWGVYTDGTLRLLEKTLNWRARNQEIIAGNIANLDTPNYTRKEMNFDKILKSYSRGVIQEVGLNTTGKGHLPGSDPSRALVEDTGDDVDLDREMVQMSTNFLSFQASTQMLIKKLDTLRSAIDGGQK
jgi:flagellar basal-body rod protein FlgB